MAAVLDSLDISLPALSEESFTPSGAVSMFREANTSGSAFKKV
jgi:hypothetical protein